jgi:hypothetical protein
MQYVALAIPLLKVSGVKEIIISILFAACAK